MEIASGGLERPGRKRESRGRELIRNEQTREDGRKVILPARNLPG
jgi:hypothetical protein